MRHKNVLNVYRSSNVSIASSKTSTRRYQLSFQQAMLSLALLFIKNIQRTQELIRGARKRRIRRQTRHQSNTQ